MRACVCVYVYTKVPLSRWFRVRVCVRACVRVRACAWGVSGLARRFREAGEEEDCFARSAWRDGGWERRARSVVQLTHSLHVTHKRGLFTSPGPGPMCRRVGLLYRDGRQDKLPAVPGLEPDPHYTQARHGRERRGTSRGTRNKILFGQRELGY